MVNWFINFNSGTYSKSTGAAVDSNRNWSHIRYGPHEVTLTPLLDANHSRYFSTSVIVIIYAALLLEVEDGL